MLDVCLPNFTPPPPSVSSAATTAPTDDIENYRRRRVSSFLALAAAAAAASTTCSASTALADSSACYAVPAAAVLPPTYSESCARDGAKPFSSSDACTRAQSSDYNLRSKQSAGKYYYYYDDVERMSSRRTVDAMSNRMYEIGDAHAHREVNGRGTFSDANEASFYAVSPHVDDLAWRRAPASAEVWLRDRAGVAKRPASSSVVMEHSFSTLSRRACSKMDLSTTPMTTASSTMRDAVTALRRSSKTVRSFVGSRTLKQISSIFGSGGASVAWPPLACSENELKRRARSLSASSCSELSYENGASAVRLSSGARRRTICLRDRCDDIAAHTQRGIDFLDRYNAFVKDRCQVELEYAQKLKSLSKKYQPRKREEDESEFTYGQAFVGVLSELNDIANQHEVIAESLRDEVQQECVRSSAEFKEQRKQLLAQTEGLRQNLARCIEALSKTKRDYQKAFKENEAAQIKLQKANDDMSLSRADLNKAKQSAAQKDQQAEDAKSTYALQLQKTNELRSQHFRELLPSVFEQLREMDEARILRLKQLIFTSAEVERKVLPIVQKCLDGMVQKTQSIDPSRDSATVVARYRSGYLPPDDEVFVDLSAPNGAGDAETSTYSNGLSSSMIGANGSPSDSSTLARRGGEARRSIDRKNSKRSAFPPIFGKKQEDFSDLPPQQRCNRLQQKIDACEAHLHDLERSRDGMVKLQRAYEADPKTGDPKVVKDAVAVNAREIHAAQTELEKYRAYLDDARQQLNLPINFVAPSSSATPRKAAKSPNVGAKGTAPPRPSSGDVDGQMPSRSSSESSVTAQRSQPSIYGSNSLAPHTTKGTSHSSNGSSTSPESGIGDTATRISYADSEPDGAEEVYTEAEPAPVLGTAKALYRFDGGSDGTIPLAEHEDVYVIERDEGDGWTRVRRKTGPRSGDEGFVPSSYIECSFFV